MADRHYSPRISRFLVCVLYHEAKTRKIPMTRLAEQLLASQLSGSQAWKQAESCLIQEQPH